MRLNQIAAPAALFTAIILSLSVVSHANADVNSSVRNHLAVTAVCGQGTHVFDIRNSGASTTSFLYYKITARAADGMPALRTWTLPLFPLAAGQVFQLTVPQAAWGLKVSVEMASAGAVIDSNAGATAFPNFCW